MPDLPPGPRLPAAVQLLATWTRPTASLERLRRYGKRITARLPFQPPFVILWDPSAACPPSFPGGRVTAPGRHRPRMTGTAFLSPVAG